MKHLKLFTESVETSKRLSVEDIEDYFLEFIDNGSISFYSHSISLSKKIQTTFKLSDKFRDIKTIEELNNFSSLINQIGNVVKRWNLDFKFSTIATGNLRHGVAQTQFSIFQTIPKVIVDFFNTSIDTMDLNGFDVSYSKKLALDDNSDFTMEVVVPHSPLMVQKWYKSDYDNFNSNESDFIKYFTDNKSLPCQYIEKKNSETSNGLKYFYYFKILV